MHQLIPVRTGGAVQFTAIDKIAIVSISIVPRVYCYNIVFLVEFLGVFI